MSRQFPPITSQEYQKELYQLKDEFERYKLRAQSVLRSKTSASKVTHNVLLYINNSLMAL